MKQPSVKGRLTFALGAMFALLLLSWMSWRGETENEVTQLSPEFPKSSSIEQLTTELQEYTRGSEGRAKEELALISNLSPSARTRAAASIRGRVVIDREPLAGARVYLRVASTLESIAAFEAMLEELDSQVLKDNHSPQEIGQYREIWFDGRDHLLTGEDGRFSWAALPSGSYQLTVQAARGPNWTDDQAEPRVTFAFNLQAGVEKDVGDLRLFDGTLEEYLAAEEKRNSPTKIRIESGQPGLKVAIRTGGPESQYIRGSTDAKGEATVQLEKGNRAQIDLLGKFGDVMGSTDRLLEFPEARETLVRIPAIPGDLVVSLPKDRAIVPGGSVQFILTRISPGAVFVNVKTVRGEHPNTEHKRVKTSASGIEYKSLRSGLYRIKAVGKYEHGSGSNLRSGEEWSAEVEVVGGETRSCVLH